MPYERELEVALAAAREASEVLLRHYHGGTETWEKSEDNPVTLADLESDKVISAALMGAFPDDGLLSEETVSDPARTEKSRVWIIDPMDGTKEFTRKIPEFCVSIALTEGGEPVVGVILNPPAGIAVWATKGGGCFRDGAEVRVSSKSALEVPGRPRITRCISLEFFQCTVG